jgi:hypothetical protein
VRPAQVDEQVHRQAGALGELAARVDGHAGDESLGGQEDQRAGVGAGTQLGKGETVGPQPLEQLEAGLARLALEAVEQALGGEVRMAAHPAQTTRASSSRGSR